MKKSKKTGSFKERAYIAPCAGPDYGGVTNSIANMIESEIAEITKCVSYALGAKHALDVTKEARELMQELRNVREEMLKGAEDLAKDRSASTEGNEEKRIFGGLTVEGVDKGIRAVQRLEDQQRAKARGVKF